MFKNERVRLTAKDGHRGLDKITEIYRSIVTRFAGIGDVLEYGNEHNSLVCAGHPCALDRARLALERRLLKSEPGSLQPPPPAGSFMERAIQACYDLVGRPGIVSLAAACLLQTV